MKMRWFNDRQNSLLLLLAPWTPPQSRRYRSVIGTRFQIEEVALVSRSGQFCASVV